MTIGYGSGEKWLPKISQRVVARGDTLRYKYREKSDAQQCRVRLTYKTTIVYARLLDMKIGDLD